MRVAVLSGGRSSEHDVSLASGESVRAGLAEAGHEVLDVEIGARRRVVATTARSSRCTRAGACWAPTSCSRSLHGPFGEDGTVQGLLEMLDVAYVGAGVLASALCMDKVLFKELMAQPRDPAGRATRRRPARWRADAGGVLRDSPLGLPVFVKPARLGSSVGHRRRSTRRGRARRGARRRVRARLAGDRRGDAPAASRSSARCSANARAERLRAGRDRAYAAPTGTTTRPSTRPGGMELSCRRGSRAARERVRALALEAFRRVGCAGLARVDFFVEGEDVLVNELNTMPGFTPTSVFPKLWRPPASPSRSCSTACAGSRSSATSASARTGF